ncbi:hypothetical protein FRC04_002871 [Tulasnella sp. 424]|nr:hypothetical protein FRC04_002871 [Tulasnella sp. 424]KAG8966548.1 hypothetical protein FRC05_002621 [Tulasnella sp. 425]
MKFAISSLIVAALSVRSALGVAIYNQCGGIDYTGDTNCDAGLVCTYQNDYYSQCLPGTGTTKATTTIATTTTKTSTTTTKTTTTTSSGSTSAATGYFTNPTMITRATTIAGLKTATAKVVWTQDSVAARCCNYWAPEVHKIGSTWYLYYSAGSSGNYDYQNIHVLQGGSTPYDTYTYKAQLAPTNAPNDWAIDGTILTISGTNYFVFSGKDTTAGQALWIAPLTNVWTAGTRSLISHPLQSWERNGSTPYYSLGLLKYSGGDPTSINSWTKTGPYLTSANGNYGPGHNGFFTTPGGVTYIVYHATANSAGGCGGNRYTMIQPMSWASDGVTPIFPVPAALSASIPAYP